MIRYTKDKYITAMCLYIILLCIAVYCPTSVLTIDGFLLDMFGTTNLKGPIVGCV